MTEIYKEPVSAAQIEQRSPRELRANRNKAQNSKELANQLATSRKAAGFIEPVIIAKNGMLLAGQCRRKVFEQLISLTPALQRGRSKPRPKTRTKAVGLRLNLGEEVEDHG
jgi:hypothetical protein